MTPRRDPAREVAKRNLYLAYFVSLREQEKAIQRLTRAIRRYARREVEEAVLQAAAMLKPAHTYASENADEYRAYEAGYSDALDAVRGHAAIRARGGRDKR